MLFIARFSLHIISTHSLHTTFHYLKKSFEFIFFNIVPLTLKGCASPENVVFSRGKRLITYPHTWGQEGFATLRFFISIYRSLLFYLSVKTHHLLKFMASHLFLYSLLSIYNMLRILYLINPLDSMVQFSFLPQLLLSSLEISKFM